VMAGAPGAREIFDVVFFVVVVSAFLPGATVGFVTRKLGLAVPSPPPPEAVIEIQSARPLAGETLSFYVEEALAVCGATIADLPIPESSAVLLIVRGQR